MGILGGGQLGRMLALEARRMGYRTVIWSGTAEAEPVMGVADEVLLCPFDDQAALAEFLDKVDVATVEFENIDHEILRAVATGVGLFPPPEAIAISQNRECEKVFLQSKGIPCAPFRVIESLTDLRKGLDELGGEAVLKTAAFGYDGKGQMRVKTGDELERIWQEFDFPKGVLEQWIPFECEISLMIARGGDGEIALYDPAENVHREHVLDHSIVPARVSESILEEARAIAIRLVEALDYQGLLGVEFFVSKSKGLLVNEMAPRPHNSGHHTMNACGTSQFEQQLRAVAGLPLGETALLTPVVMLNLLGDLWRAPGFQESLVRQENSFWHFYGKSSNEGMRKCGHLNFLGEGALTRALAFKDSLLKGPRAE